MTGFYAARRYPFEEKILAEAVRFSVTVYRGRNLYETASAYSLEEARAAAPGLYDAEDRRPVMIYAVTDVGTSALIETYEPGRKS